MANANKRKYKRNFCVGIRLEVPNKFLHNKDIFRVYKDKGWYLYDICIGGKVVSKRVNDLLLAKNDGSSNNSNISNFSVLISLGEDLEKVERIIKIMNILGDDKIFKEKAKTFVSGKSILNSIPELCGLKQALLFLSQEFPKIIENAWLNAPDAKLR